MKHVNPYAQWRRKGGTKCSPKSPCPDLWHFEGRDEGRGFGTSTASSTSERSNLVPRGRRILRQSRATGHMLFQDLRALGFFA
jgi:hypothetical protein